MTFQNVKSNRQLKANEIRLTYFVRLQIMQDEVSETENIRKNLSIERMIVEGCDILLDVNQTFVRQGETRCCSW